MNYKYKIFRHFTNLLTLDENLEFAVVVASEKEVAIAGINLSELGVKAVHPFDNRLINNTIDAVWANRIGYIFDEKPKDGFEVLAKLYNKSPTNFNLSDEFSKDSDEPIEQVAHSLFKEIISDDAQNILSHVRSF